MATSLIDTECKRYGCRKNLLACYANCRYNTRCEELRNEVTSNFEQATKDINNYRQERGLNLVEIQMPKRGLKFAEIVNKPVKPAGKKKEPLKLKAAPPRQHHPKMIDGDTSPPATRPVLKRKTKKRRAKPRVTKPQVSKIQPPRRELTLEQTASPAQPMKSLQSKLAKTNPEPRIKMPKKMKSEATVPATSNDERLPASPVEAANTAQNEPAKIATPGRKGSKSSAAKKPKKLYIIIEGERGTVVGEQGLLNRILAGVSPGARYFEATELEVRLQISHKK